MFRRSIRQIGPLDGPLDRHLSEVSSGPAARRVAARRAGPAVMPLITREELERRLRERKLPPIVMILVSLALWVLIFFIGRALLAG